MSDKDISALEARLAAIEQRLQQLESGLHEPPHKVETPPQETTADKPVPIRKRPLSGSKQPADSNLNVTNILGWAGATALVLAAAYLIRLSIESGWLTPMRQIGLAALGAAGLIAIGLKLRHSQRQYASLLPAGGIVILFLSIYGAHLYFGMLDPQTAGLLVICVCVLSLWLCRLFENQLYALFAVIGSYSAPFMLGYQYADIFDLVIYFTAWSILFSIYSIWVRNRLAYLLALYLSLTGFDIIWRYANSADWDLAASFQAMQFLIFLLGATFYSIRHSEPLTKSQAYAHAPALLIFYMLEYNVLDRHLPDYASWFAIASLLLLSIAYLLARQVHRKPAEGGRWLISFYATIVLVHAAYLDLTPAEYRPWFAVILVILTVLISLPDRIKFSPGTPLLLGIVGIYFMNYWRIVTDTEMSNVPYGNLAGFLYALQLYAGYYLTRGKPVRHLYRRLLIYTGHIVAMAGSLYFFDERFTVSIAWGLISIICLALALRFRDRTLGQSSLIVFAASAIKVLLYDLSDASPLVRIACLLVLGVTFYLGGWLYRKLNDLSSPLSQHAGNVHQAPS